MLWVWKGRKGVNMSKKESLLPNEKNEFLLKILEKVTLANNIQLMILGGYRDPSVVRKRINKLIDGDYIKGEYQGSHKVYTLTQKGLGELEKTRKPYEITGTKSRHEELVAEAACWLYIRTGRGIMDMMFDHEMNSVNVFKNSGHKPDIAFSMHQALEVELTSKSTHGDASKNGLLDNFRSNVKNYSKQIWIIPDNKPGLKKRLGELRDKYAKEGTVYIYTTGMIHRTVQAFADEDDLRKSNTVRDTPVKGIPCPKETPRIKDIMEELQ